MAALELTETTHTLEMVTSTAEKVDYEASWVDITPAGDGSATYDEGSAHGSISAAADTTIVSAPAAGQRRRIVHLNVRNAGAGANVVTIQKDVSGTEYTMIGVSLAVGETLEYD